jgi:hypothetical protein
LPEAVSSADAQDYQRVDVGSVDHEHARTVDAAIGVIAARLISPGSERSTHVWLQNMTALDDLLGADFVNLSRDRVYKTADMLLRYQSEIEVHLRGRERSLFQLQ